MAKNDKPEKADPKAGTAETTPEEKAPSRLPFVQTPIAKPLLDGDGRLTKVPVIGDADGAFNPSSHLAPKKGDFNDDVVYLEFKAAYDEFRAQEFATRASRYREQAEQIKKYGDPAARAKVRRFTQMRERLAELEAQLAAEGIEL